MLTREQWLTEISDLIVGEIFLPSGAKIRESMKLKLSVGFPPGTKSETSVIGVCFPSSASKERFNEIFISPVIDNSLQVLEVLVHEIVHAIDDCKSGHKGAFAKLARAVGLEGKLTATHASDALRAKLQEYVDMFGPIPHAQVNYKARKRQTNRQLKVWCSCGFKFNTSRTQINYVNELVGAIICPACTQPMSHD